MSQQELKDLISALESEAQSLSFACMEATKAGEPDTVESVEHALTSLDAAVSHLHRFYRRRAKF